MAHCFLLFFVVVLLPDPGPGPDPDPGPGLVTDPAGSALTTAAKFLLLRRALHNIWSTSLTQ